MRPERVPSWILKYKRKVRNMRFWGIMLFVYGISSCFILSLISGDIPYFTALLLTIGLFESVFAVIFGFSMFVGARVKYIKVNEYYICHYVGWKNRLIIDEEEQDSSMMGKCYGTLPDGREVTSGGVFGIHFEVYDPTTRRTRRF